MDSKDNEKNGDWSVIMTDSLNPYASEFAQLTHNDDYAQRFNLFLTDIDNASNAVVKHTVCGESFDKVFDDANPFIDGKIDIVEEAIVAAASSASANTAEMPTLASESGVEADAVSSTTTVTNFWTTPSSTERARVTSPDSASKLEKPRTFCASEYRLPAEEPAFASLSPTAKKAQIFAPRIVLPLAFSMIFVGALAAAAVQLNNLSTKNCADSKMLSDNGKYQEALLAAGEAVKYNPLSGQAYFEKGRALVRLMRYREAKECLDRSLALNGDSAVALDSRAALALKMSQPQQAIVDLQKLAALQNDSLSVMQRGNLAVAFYKSGQYDRSIEAYDRALTLDSENVTLRLGRAYCLAGKQQHKTALAVCDSLLKQSGDNTKVLALRGYCYQRLNKTDRALQDFNRALSKDPTNAAIYTYRAGLMEQLKKPELALDDYIKAADLDRDNAQATCTVARALKNAGRNQEALAYYNKLALFPGFDRSFDQHQDRAALNYSAGHYQACLSDLNRAIELEPDCDLHVQKALCLAKLGRASDARATIAEAHRLSPENTEVTVADGQVEAILGQTLSAVDKFSLALSAAADNKDALVGRGTCYFSRDQWASAAQDFKKAIALGTTDNLVKIKLARCQEVLTSGARVSLDLPARRVIDLAKLNRAQLFDSGTKACVGGDNQLATLYFGELARREPSNTEARTNLAYSYEGAGMHEEAIATFAPLSVANQLDVRAQACYAHALAATGLYERSIAIMQRLNDREPANLAFRLDLIKMFSAAGQIDKAISICHDALSLHGSTAERSSLNNVYESLVTEKSRSKNEGTSGNTTAVKPETEG
ncbi:MAG: tetratricopeptide repeat protein [Cyanobacteria bacterium REEB67]|nr:tetratricopeptide repeat protein [Cyanobacteria bacterium REEB67]